jgi:hypothetical protein
VTSVVRNAPFACLALVLLACGSGAGSSASATPSAAPSASPGPTLTAADLAQVAQLERKPVSIPAPAADGACHQGPFTPQIVPYANGGSEMEVYGTSPVYGLGGPSHHVNSYVYFDVTYFTSPSVKGVVLVRINDLSGKYPGRFVGPFAVGRSLGTDTIDGHATPVFSELALPTENRPASVPGAAPGWGVWHIRQGIDQQFTCAAIQIDTATTTEVILAH